MAKSSPPPVPEADLIDVTLKALAQAPKPITAAAVRKGLSGPFRRPEPEVAALLERMAAAGQAFSYPPARGKPTYSNRSPDDFARRECLAALKAKPLAADQLDKKVAKAAPGCPEARRKQIVAELLREGRLFRLPKAPRAKHESYSLRPADPREHLKKPLEGVAQAIDQLAACGVSRQTALEAVVEILGGKPASPQARPDLEQAVLQGMLTINPAADRSAISLRELWQNVGPEFPDK